MNSNENPGNCDLTEISGDQAVLSILRYSLQWNRKSSVPFTHISKRENTWWASEFFLISIYYNWMYYFNLFNESYQLWKVLKSKRTFELAYAVAWPVIKCQKKITDQDALWSLWPAPLGESQCRPLGLWINAIWLTTLHLRNSPWLALWALVET